MSADEKGGTPWTGGKPWMCSTCNHYSGDHAPNCYYTECECKMFAPPAPAPVDDGWAQAGYRQGYRDGVKAAADIWPDEPFIRLTILALLDAEKP